MGPIRANQCSNDSRQQIPLIFGLLELVAVCISNKRMHRHAIMNQWKRTCIPGALYTSAPAYLPDPLFDFSEGLVLRLGLKWGIIL